MSEDDYSDDFSRQEDTKYENQEILIDEQVAIEDDHDIDQQINRAENDARRIKKPYPKRQPDEDPNVFVSPNKFHFQEPHK